MVRLYFSPFSSNEFELFNSKFNVSVSGFSLLSDFNAGNTTTIREIIIPIGSDRTVRIEFTPSNSSSPAFVNAIEAFTTPNNLFNDAVLPQISPAGKIADVDNITSSYAVKPIYRVNVGGRRIDVEDDTLRRNWTPDDVFIFNNEPAKNSTPFDGALNYKKDGATSFDAPYDVYRTAKQLTNSLVNITWIFGVNTNSIYFVRAHFCDIISTGLGNPDDAFDFFVYSHFKIVIPPGNRMWELQSPFYVDFVVDSVESEVLNVSIGAIRGNNKTVFLNGLEIMELVKHSGVVNLRKNGNNNNKKVYIVVGCVVGGVVFVLVLLLGFFVGSKFEKAKAKPESSYMRINIDFSVKNPLPIPNLNLSLRFPFADILQATNNFDEKLMIGKGGFGKVYKGTFHNGTIVAVKRGENEHGQGRPEFMKEITVLSKIQHRYLVSLIGYCDENSEMILVYEFMEKGTLKDHLYDTKDHPKLSWNQRLEICITASRGLHYLHTGSDTGIIHRDVKSTNILLNENYVAKVADFGIFRLENFDETEITDIKGSLGYMDPEYIRRMKLTQKSDVYSFGVVLLEVLCARPALDNLLPREEANLVDWGIKHIKNEMVEVIIDPFLVGTIKADSLRVFLEIVEKCLKDRGDERPSMIDVSRELEYAWKLQLKVVDKDAYEDITSLKLPMSTIHRLSSFNDDSEVNDSSASSYPSEGQVFSNLKIDEAR